MRSALFIFTGVAPSALVRGFFRATASRPGGSAFSAALLLFEVRVLGAREFAI
ncbi:MAG: hypothetical protein ACR2FX_01420 [Chthoniobacterales bacterium]